MAAISKPTDINKIWSAGGGLLAPSDAKINTGWVVEIPDYQYFNYLDNKQDRFNAHSNQFGIPVWDAVTEYQANKSLSQGSDGIIYRCLITSTNVNPVGDTTSSWEVAFISTAQTTGSFQSLATNGYKMHPGGMMEAWGQFTTNATTQTVSVTFAQAFLTAPFSIVGSHYGGGGAIFVVKTDVSQPTANGFTAMISTAFQSTGTGAYTGTYHAIGRWK